MHSKNIQLLVNIYHAFMNLLHKYRLIMVVIWIACLITLGVLQYYVTQKIEIEGSRAGGSGDTRPVR
jgi:preprotein translocase subunit SecG